MQNTFITLIFENNFLHDHILWLKEKRLSKSTTLSNSITPTKFEFAGISWSDVGEIYFFKMSKTRGVCRDRSKVKG